MRSLEKLLTQIHEAGVIDLAHLADERYYSIEFKDRANLLRLGSAPSLRLVTLDPESPRNRIYFGVGSRAGASVDSPSGCRAAA